MVFAGLTHRFIAACVDAVIVFFLFTLVAFGAEAIATWRTSPIGALCGVVLLWFGFLPATKLQGTPGKRLTGIKVTGMHGERVGLGPSLLRFALWLLTLGTLGLGFLLAAWMPKRQALHDFGARTLVVNRKATPAEIATAVAPPMWWFNRVLGVAALAAILAILYSTYDIRESMNLRSRVQSVLVDNLRYEAEVESAMRAGRAPSITIAKLPPHARAIGVKPDGTIVYEIADAVVRDGRIYYKPSRTGEGFQWKCSAENIPSNLLPGNCRP